jgi:hypothetical protein
VKNGYFLAAELIAGTEMPQMREKTIEHILQVSLPADLTAANGTSCPSKKPGERNKRRSGGAQHVRSWTAA